MYLTLMPKISVKRMKNKWLYSRIWISNFSNLWRINKMSHKLRMLNKNKFNIEMRNLISSRNSFEKFFRNSKTNFKNKNYIQTNLNGIGIKIIHATTFQFHRKSLSMEKLTTTNSVVRMICQSLIISNFRIKIAYLISIKKII